MKIKKSAKGFTLVELIVVMAVFGLIMLGAMQFLDPVGRMMRRASVQEANSASVDIIKRYFEGTLRYANIVDVYDSGFTKYDSGTGKYEKIDEAAAVENFVDKHYMNCADQDSNPVTGTVHVMKIMNTEGGKILEDTYSFTAGYTYRKWDPTIAPSGDFESAVNASGKVPGTVTDGTKDVEAINPVYYNDYNYYISPGYQTINVMNPAGTDSSGNLLIADDEVSCYKPNISWMTSKQQNDVYFGRLASQDGGTAASSFSASNFTLTFVSYKNYDNHYTLPEIVDDNVLFPAPYYASSGSLALINTNSAYGDKYRSSLNWYPIRYEGGTKPDGSPYQKTDKVDINEDGQWDYDSKLTPPSSFNLYSTDRSNLGDSLPESDRDDLNNIYIIYTTPQ